MITVFFDLDGTLLETRDHLPTMYAQVLGALGLARSAGEVEGALQRSWRWYEEQVGQHGSDELAFWLRFNEQVCLALNAGEWVDAAGEAVTELFHSVGSPTLFDDALPCLDALAEAGYPLGVITARPDAARVIEPLGLLPRFKWLVDAFQAGSAKTDTRAFHFALSLAGVTPREAVHIGDQYARDVVPAQEAGMTAILLDRESRFPEADCPRMTSLAELPQWLGRRG